MSKARTETMTTPSAASVEAWREAISDAIVTHVWCSAVDNELHGVNDAVNEIVASALSLTDARARKAEEENAELTRIYQAALAVYMSMQPSAEKAALGHALDRGPPKSQQPQTDVREFVARLNESSQDV